MTRIKVCGMCHEEDIALCVEEGVNILGFVIEHPMPTPWGLTRERAAKLMRSVPPFVSRVAVVGGDADTIIKICEDLRPHAVQVHGEESEEVIAELKASLTDMGITIIKGIRIHINAADASFESNSVPLQSWEGIAKGFLNAGADAILLDSMTNDLPAGTGKPFDWQIAQRVSAAVSPLILAGGLTPENVGSAIAKVRPSAVDVISSLEDKRHRKVRERVRAFVRAVREADTASVVCC